MGSNLSYFKKPEFPVVNVSLNDAIDFIGKLNNMYEKGKFGLPAAAQWEYACRDRHHKIEVLMSPAKRQIFRFNRFLHKWLGLISIIYIILMALSGIIANHPRLTDGITFKCSSPEKRVDYENWNRGSARCVVYTGTDSESAFLGGRQGIWKISRNGDQIEPFMRNYPSSPMARDVWDLYFDEPSERLFAATGNGIYFYDFVSDKHGWQPCSGISSSVKNIFSIRGRIAAVSDSLFYLNSSESSTSFEGLFLPDLPELKEHSEGTLNDLFLNIHTGEIIGLRGKLLVDFLGILIIVLSVTAVFIWHIPFRFKNKKRRGRPASASEKAMYRSSYKIHSGIGSKFILPLFIVVLAAFLIFLPIPSWQKHLFEPVSFSTDDLLDSNPWKRQISGALYDPLQQKIIFLVKNGLVSCDVGEDYEIGEPDFFSDFSVMQAGLFVYDPLSKAYMIGGFEGLFRYYPEYDRAEAVKSVNGKISHLCGYMKTPEGSEYYFNNYKGLRRINTVSDDWSLPDMPGAINNEAVVSLSEIASEFHSGRIYQPVFGRAWWLPSFICSLVLLLLMISGVILRIFHKTGK